MINWILNRTRYRFLKNTNINIEDNNVMSVKEELAVVKDKLLYVLKNLNKMNDLTVNSHLNYHFKYNRNYKKGSFKVKSSDYDLLLEIEIDESEVFKISYVSVYDEKNIQDIVNILYSIVVAHLEEKEDGKIKNKKNISNHLKSDIEKYNV